MTKKIETKVTAATAGAVVASFALWLLEILVFKGTVPVPVQGMVFLVIPLIVTFAAGWFAPHVSRTASEARSLNSRAEPIQFRE